MRIQSIFILTLALILGLISSQLFAQGKGGNRGGSQIRVRFHTGGGNAQNHAFHNANRGRSGNQFGSQQFRHFQQHNNPHWYKTSYRFNPRHRNVHFVQFHQFPYRTCWYGGQYWVCFNGYWMPYQYLVQNHFGAWQWHQAHFHLHSHRQFVQGGFQGQLKYGK